jgi:O-antigen ligase
VLWGSAVPIVARITLPFIVFFAARIFITEPKQIGIILIAIAVGYIFPIFKSTYDIISGRGIEMINYWTGMERFEGSFGGSHQLAYAMLFFSFIYCLLNRTHQFKGRWSKSGLLVLQLLTIFCMYKSYTRTAYGGFFIFWSIYLWGTNKKRFALVIIACILVAVVASQKIATIFWQPGQHQQTIQNNLNAASSGRLNIWRHNIQVFLDSSIPQKLLGRGLGIEARRNIDPKQNVWAPHNNFLNLLMSLGVIGLLMYLTLLVVLLWDIYMSELNMGFKCLFAGIIVSTIAMSFVSNAVILRVELSQYFWLFMGIFYFLKEKADADRLSSMELSQSHSSL